MTTELVHVGFRNMLAINKVIAVLAPDQEPTRRLIREAKSKGLLLDATHARKTKATLIMDTGHVAVVAIAPDTIAARLTATIRDATAGIGHGGE